jgi:hypothetical protein
MKKSSFRSDSCSPSLNILQYGTCAFHAEHLKLQTQTQNMQYLILFHGNSGHVSHRTLPVLPKITGTHNLSSVELGNKSSSSVELTHSRYTTPQRTVPATNRTNKCYHQSALASTEHCAQPWRSEPVCSGGLHKLSCLLIRDE